MAIFKLIHLLSVLVWVGGMFFAYMVLRPTAVEVLQPPERLRLWVGVFTRFFKWVWFSIALLLGTGLYMIYLYGGLAESPRFVHIMLLLGIMMIAIFFYVNFRCVVPLRLLVGAERWKEAGEMLGRIRKLIGFNLTLGMITVAVAVLGLAMM